MPLRVSLKQRLEPYGQAHLIGFWDQLSDQQRQSLHDQIAAVDLGLIGSLYRGQVDQPDWAALARRASPPTAVRLAERQPTANPSTQKAIEAGRAALAAGKIGVILVAGGQGSRLGFEHPKGMYPIGPVSGCTLLQIHAEKTLATAKRYGAPVPLCIMTSPATHAEQVEFLNTTSRFGLPAEDVLFFQQGSMPAVDEATGKLLLERPDALCLSPDGHGGCIAALSASGTLDILRSRGVEHLFYLQVDNPLVPICDPELIGHHLLAGSELTSMAVAKQQPDDKLGNFVEIDGRLQVIEYSDMPADVAQQRTPEGGLRLWSGSIAVHVFAVDFLRRMLAESDGLPFHVARKKVPHINAQGDWIEPAEPNALKFERFIFDLLPKANNPLVVEYAEADVFAPLKNAPGASKDTEAYVRMFMADQQHKWLESAGARVSPGATVEISPLFALDADDLKTRVAPGTIFDRSTYLRPS